MTHTIAYFTDSTSFGGAEQALITLMEGLDRRRWQPLLLHHESPGIAPMLVQAARLGIACRVVPPMPEGIAGALHIAGFARMLHEIQVDIFHAYLTWQRSCKYALLAAALARTSVVATVQLLVTLPESRVDRIKQRMFGAGIKRYIAVSHDQVQWLHGLYGIPVNRIRVVPNAVPFTRLRRQPTVAASTPIRPIVLTVARLDKQKGLDVLLQAAVHVPNVLFVIAGDGPERSALEAQAQALGVADRVLFLGNREDIPELLRQCDLFVLPSRYEGLPLAVLEAMAAGRPVITTAIDGTREAIVHGESGILIPPDNSRALAGSIQALLASPMLAHRLADAGRERVIQKFSPNAMVRQITEVYGTLLAPRKGC